MLPARQPEPSALPLPRRLRERAEGNRLRETARRKIPRAGLTRNNRAAALRTARMVGPAWAETISAPVGRSGPLTNFISARVVASGAIDSDHLYVPDKDGQVLIPGSGADGNVPIPDRAVREGLLGQGKTNLVEALAYLATFVRWNPLRIFLTRLLLDLSLLSSSLSF